MAYEKANDLKRRLDEENIEVVKTLDAPRNVSKWKKKTDYMDFYKFFRNLDNRLQKMNILEYHSLTPQLKEAYMFTGSLRLMGRYLIAMEVNNNSNITDDEGERDGEVSVGEGGVGNEVNWDFSPRNDIDNWNKMISIERRKEHPKFGSAEVENIMIPAMRQFMKGMKGKLEDTTYSKIIRVIVRRYDLTKRNAERTGRFRKQGLYKYIDTNKKNRKTGGFSDSGVYEYYSKAMAKRRDGGKFENPDDRDMVKRNFVDKVSGIKYKSLEAAREGVRIREEKEEAAKPKEAAAKPKEEAAKPTKKKKLVLKIKKPKEVAKTAMASVREVVKMEKTPKLKKQFIERVRKELDEFEKTLIPQKELDADMDKARDAVAKARALRRINKAKEDL
tara:strand:- start:273 stop:1439 length:1167 start_codon:yes stop_codon:yes gene_type:complete